METKAIVGVMLIMVMFIGQATAGFEECYAACYFDCIIDTKRHIPYVPKKFLPCAWKCLKHCIAHPGSSTSSKDVYYCKMGCSIDSCTEDVDDAKKMNGCLDDCSNNYCKPMTENSRA